MITQPELPVFKEDSPLTLKETTQIELAVIEGISKTTPKWGVVRAGGGYSCADAIAYEDTGNGKRKLSAIIEVKSRRSGVHELIHQYNGNMVLDRVKWDGLRQLSVLTQCEVFLYSYFIPDDSVLKTQLFNSVGGPIVKSWSLEALAPTSVDGPRRKKELVQFSTQGSELALIQLISKQ